MSLSCWQMHVHSILYTLTVLRCVIDEVSDNLKVWITAQPYSSTQRGDSGKSVRQRGTRPLETVKGTLSEKTQA